MAEIHWPPGYRPEATAVHVSNELVMQAPPERVWAWLIRAPLWPTWYENSKNVVILDGAGATGDSCPGARLEDSSSEWVRGALGQGDLALGTRFRWETFGLSIRSVVEEFVPNERIGWTGAGMGMDVYHGWVIEPRPEGCYVLTQEHQNGLAARVQSVIAPERMHKYHQIWLESLNERAKRGLPSPVVST